MFWRPPKKAPAAAAEPTRYGRTIRKKAYKMEDSSTRNKIDRIILDLETSADEKVDALKALKEEVRLHRRSLQTSGIVNASDHGDDLEQIDKALKDLGISPDSFKGTGV